MPDSPADRAGVSGAPPVDAYLARLRRRAALLHGLRAAIGALGAAGITFALGALAVGPVGEPSLAAVAWLLVAAAIAAVSLWGWRAFAPLRGAGVARLLGGAAPGLSSAARTAFELSRSAPEHASHAMIRAHEARVRAALAAIPPRRVVRWRWLHHRATLLGALGLAVAALLLVTERGGAGAYALTHPGARDAHGDRVAVAFSDVEAHLVYPSYLDRSSTSVLDPSVLEVPRGTSIEVRARARLRGASAALRIGSRDVPMELDGRGRWVGRFVAREDGALLLRLHRAGGEWINDARERLVRALSDDAPRVTMLDPAEDVVLDRPDAVEIAWDATDDVGISHVDLVVRDGGGVERRRRVASYPESAHPAMASGSAPVDLALHELRPGDTVTVWVEAHDGDLVGGPNVGRSAERSITLASEATRREQRLDALEAVLDRAIGTLADRLERPVPEVEAQARPRFDAMAASTEAFVEALTRHAEQLRRSGEARGTDRALYVEMAARVRRLLHEERLAHGRSVAGLDRRRDVDGRAVTELEDDVLTLDDLLSRARMEDAAAIARELEALRREIHSLLSELVRTDSREAREQLLAAIGRAQARMRELMQRIAEMGTNVPQEFLNAGDMGGEAAASEDVLARMREAVQQGNLELADRLVAELSRQLDQLARMLGQTEAGFAEARFGPRERAFAEALDALGGVEAEQGQLSRRSTERRGRAAQRALEASGGRDNRAARRLADQARAVRDALEEIDRAGLASFEQDAYDRARQRLIDTQDALRTGDLGEARRMAEAAAQDMAGLTRDLDLSALMFPGHEGETSDDARRARSADRQLRDLRRQLDEALPDVASHVDPPGRAQMREDSARQARAREAAERLARQFDEGPDGAALDEQAGRELHDAAREMREAQQALDRGDPLDSARRQEDAARRLTELRERLEQESQSGGGGGGDGGDATRDFRQAVDIPDADQFEGPMEMRRRLLDAMREQAPRGYEDAVRRYYEGLLR